MSILVALLAVLMGLPWLMFWVAPLVIVTATSTVALVKIIRLAFGSKGMEDQQFLLQKAYRQKVLVVDDDYASVLPLIGLLEGGNVDVHFVSDGFSMIEELQSGDYDFIFLDSRMPQMTGQLALETGDELLNLTRKQPVIFYSSFFSPKDVPRDLKHFDVRGTWPKDDLHGLQSNVSQLLGSHSELGA